MSTRRVSYKKPSLSYAFQKANVSVVFYDNKYFIGKVISFFNWTRLHHCGIIFTIDGQSVLLMCEKNRKSRFVDADMFHKKFYYPTHKLELGDAMVSIGQLTNYLKFPYIGDSRSVGVWYLLTRPIFRCKSLQPKTCSLLVSNFLRLCGFGVRDCVTPKQLYREVQKLCS